MKEIKKIKIHNKLLLLISLVLFFFAGFYIFQEISEKSKEFYLLEFKIHPFAFCLFVFILISLQFFNWLFEAIKFKILFKPYEVISLKRSIVSVYIGNFTSFFTPDRIGSFIGRILYLKNSSKLMITAVTALGNLAQLLTTVFFMIIGCILCLIIDHQLKEIPTEIVLMFMLIYLSLFFVLIIIYFRPSYLFKFMSRWELAKNYISRLNTLDQISIKNKSSVLILSMLRYFIFYLQFYVLIYFLELNISEIELFIFIGILYGIITFIPSPFMGNLGTREALSIYLASETIGLYAPIITFAIWLVNVALSTIIGGGLYSYILRKERR